MKYAGGHYLCTYCWWNLLNPSEHMRRYDLPPEIARQILNTHVIHGYEQQSRWESFTMRTFGRALTDGLATFYPTAWMLMLAWMAYEGATDGKPIKAFGLLVFGGWLGACAVHLFYTRYTECTCNKGGLDD
jgi:hypothetical protein